MPIAKRQKNKVVPKNVEAYLQTVPPSSVAPLRALRATIRAAAPGAEEVISYGVPTYRYQGGALVSFAATPHHCAFYVMSTRPILSRRRELKSYDTAPSAIRFRPDEPLPETLVTAIVQERIAENERKSGRGGVR